MAPDIDNADEGRPTRPRWHVPVLIALLAYAAALRFYDLGGPSLWIDEGFSIIHARVILDHGLPRLPGGEISWSYAPAHYAMAAGIGLTSAPVWGGRAGSALAGTLVVALLFGLCRRLLNERVTALLAAWWRLMNTGCSAIIGTTWRARHKSCRLWKKSAALPPSALCAA